MSSLVVDILVIGLSALAPAAAGAVEFSTQAPLLFAAVIVMLVDSRRVAARVLAPVIGLAGLLALLCCSAYLPNTWLGGAAVRERLQEALDLELSTTGTLQPWMTLESLLILVVNLVWGYYLITRSWVLSRTRILTIFCALLGLLAVVSLIYFWHGSRPPFWPANAAFGPCPNRNETGFIFGLAGLLCFCLAFRKSNQRPPSIVGWLGAYLLFGVALIFNLSRSGILILVGGPLLWVIGNVVTKQIRVLDALKLGLALSLVGVLFLIFGGKSLKRFGEVPTTLAGDYRVLIQKDALQLAHAASVVGVGAGNFEAIFPFYRSASSNEKRALHPESDWVCLTAELGWFAVPIAWGLLGWLVWRTTVIAEQHDRRLMLGASVAGICFWLHGFVDMNAHRMGAVWPLLLVFAVGQPRQVEAANLAQRGVRWSMGLILLGLLTFTAWLGPRLYINFPGTSLRRQLDAEFTVAGNAQDYARCQQICEAALAITPLDWRLYFQRAWTTLARRGDVNEAVADFARARALEPNLPELPILEFQYWWHFDWPEQTSLAMDECFRRGGYTEAMFDHIFQYCRKEPGLMRALLRPAAHAPATQLRYLRDAPPALFGEMLPLVLSGSLDTWTVAQRTYLYRLWAEQEERTQLGPFLANHAEELAYAWPAWARVQMRAQKFEEASELIAHWIKPPKLPELTSHESTPALYHRLELNPADYGATLWLATRLQHEGNPTEALHLLAKVAAKESAPVYFYYLIFQLHYAQHDWRAAGEAWLHYDEKLARTSSK